MRVPQTGTRSIGEVLALMKQEFSDITISKIRFLESQGLINPERTASGYRKFRDEDVTRLRYILRQQKEHFLPLKVIKGRLDVERGSGAEQVVEASPVSAVVAALPNGAVVASRTELLEASGLNEAQLRELEGFGLVQGQKSGTAVLYSDEAFAVAKLAARFLQFGIGARHLRIFKTAADREADLYKQLAGPVSGSRNTQARMEAVARLEELNRLGEAMRSGLLRQALESH